MTIQYFVLTTLDPIVVSESNATVNNQMSLDFIPGSALLGALAGRLYRELSGEQSWALFHSGTWRFGPCYPLQDNRLALPVPLSWHHQKHAPVVEPQTSQFAEHITNHAHTGFVREANTQYVQMSADYVTADAQRIRVSRGQNTKTALESETGKVAPGQLFTYGHIDPGQQFVGFVAMDPQDTELQQRVTNALNGEYRIGRARSNEYGRVRIQTIEYALPEASDAPDRLTLWCLSDCAFVDAQGMHHVMPCGEDIHPQLKGASLDTRHSFIRAHTLSRFNQKRGGFDSEQRVITRGSVLSFRLSSAVPRQVLHEISQNGIGTDKQFGQGWVMVNPAWATQSNPCREAVFCCDDIPTSGAQSLSDEAISNLSTPLIDWLRAQGTREQQLRERAMWVRDQVTTLLTYYRQARSYNHVLPSYQAGPSQNQWRRIADLLNHASDDWFERAFGRDGVADKDSGHICKASNDEYGWGIRWQGVDGFTHFAEASKSLFCNADGSAIELVLARQLLEQICRYELATPGGLKDMQALLDKQKAQSNEEVTQ
ncbi:hypothetical protein [Pseudoalteromonas sp. R3]|uniref:hypothetical protein n=1 Tax=Pseudoalteromonas sp. R3 TaxID=1709477 RepID=UPI0006B4D46E|nr:hypothetical protein [Pseudoalteromonas sp. R3]AZZ97517.1 hypothetical protein ELR70_10515 [Pseudoalteromonas sp. R3]